MQDLRLEIEAKADLTSPSQLRLRLALLVRSPPPFVIKVEAGLTV